MFKFTVLIIILILIGMFFYSVAIKMTKQDRFNSLFFYYTQGTCFDWRLFKWMALVESSLEPRAVSEAGALGLMQLMPETAEEMKVNYAFDVEENIRGGINYFRIQFQHFPEIPDRTERIKFSLASYNGGRGYINKAISLAKKAGVDWQKWDVVKNYLAFPSCRIKGKAPDYRQITNYVAKVMGLYKND
jgi:membrane-bound lytic murein transglycosylase MltF